MGRTTFTRAFIVVCWIALVAGSCSKKSIKPEPVVGSRVYVVVVGDPDKLFTFDGAADTLIDSIVLPISGGFPIPRADPCRPRVALPILDRVYIYRADETEPAGVYKVSFAGFFFTRDETLVIGSHGGSNCAAPGQIALYRLPELEVEFEDTLPLALMQVDSERGLVYGMVLRCLSPRRLSFTGFGSYDYLNQKIDDTWTINPDSNGKSSYVASYHVNAARRRLYAVARTSEGFRLICHDLDQKTNVFEFPLDWGKEPRLTPDGLELWLPNHSDESISVHDAEDGTLLAVIDLSDYGGTGRSPVAPTHIRFVPDGSKAYVTSSYAPAPLLVIDTKERSVKKAFFADGRRYPTSLDIGPAPRRDAPPQTMLMGSDATVGEF